ncbi:MAG: hypothetical protein ACPGUE_17765 [Marinomonas sp.]|nr:MULTISPECIES: hypothetical protein [unclassified Marinomonas]
MFRSVWKGVYERRDAVIEIGIYKKRGYLVFDSVGCLLVSR